jgi:uncharacterized membrane protein YjfL (UPF0719 family)
MGVFLGAAPVPIVQDALTTVGWTFLAVILFYGGVRLFDLLDPIDYQSEIRRGNLAAGILLAAMIISLSAIIIAVIVT